MDLAPNLMISADGDTKGDIVYIPEDIEQSGQKEDGSDQKTGETEEPQKQAQARGDEDADKVEVEGDGPGMARSIYAGGEECVVEVLESLEPAERRVGYTITQNNPLPVADYHAHCTAIEVGANSSRLRWACDFTPADGVDESLAVAQVEAMYGVLAGWVKNAIEESS